MEINNIEIKEAPLLSHDGVWFNDMIVRMANGKSYNVSGEIGLGVVEAWLKGNRENIVPAADGEGETIELAPWDFVNSKPLFKDNREHWFSLVRYALQDTDFSVLTPIA